MHSDEQPSSPAARPSGERNAQPGNAKRARRWPLPLPLLLLLPAAPSSARQHTRKHGTHGATIPPHTSFFYTAHHRLSISHCTHRDSGGMCAGGTVALPRGLWDGRADSRGVFGKALRPPFCGPHLTRYSLIMHAYWMILDVLHHCAMLHPSSSSLLVAAACLTGAPPSPACLLAHTRSHRTGQNK